jgi:flagellar assembly protein FliH
MIRSLTLEEFGSDANAAPLSRNPGENPSIAGGLSSDEERLEVYEKGYQSGWDDCAAAEAELQRNVSADLAGRLNDFDFTYAEARRDVLGSLGPLFEDMAAQLLPRLAAEAVAPTVISELLAAAETASASDIVLVAAPVTVPVIERLLEMQDRTDIRVTPEPAYAEAQISVRYAGTRRDIDLGDTAARMADALRAFIEDQTRRAEVQDRIPTGAAG